MMFSASIDAGARIAPLEVLIMADSKAPKNIICKNKFPCINTTFGITDCASPSINSGYSCLEHNPIKSGIKPIVKYMAALMYEAFTEISADLAAITL